MSASTPVKNDYFYRDTKITTTKEHTGGGLGGIHSGTIKAVLGADLLPIPTRQ